MSESKEATRSESSSAMSAKVSGPVMAFATGLIAVAWLRLQSGGAGIAAEMSAYATMLYVGLTITAVILFRRAGIPTRRLGFGSPHRPLQYVALATVGVLLLQLSGSFLGPAWEQLFGSERNLARFADVGGSLSQLMGVLALSWTVAAFGEEIAFRILLMRGVAFALGDNRVAVAIALVTQAIIFSLVHAYQGPAGIAGTFTSGLIYGVLTLAARGSIWPAALAHGINNTIGLLTIYAQG